VGQALNVDQGLRCEYRRLEGTETERVGTQPFDRHSARCDGNLTRIARRSARHQQHTQDSDQRLSQSSHLTHTDSKSEQMVPAEVTDFR
jgi:hypothetical protein